jgi:predicted transport protein
MTPRRKPPTSKAEATIPVHTGIVANPSTVGAPTPERILDELAYARDDHDNPRSFLSVDAMFNKIAHTIYGHAPIAEAQRQGFGGTNVQLMERGRRPYFERCVRDLLDAGRLVMPLPAVIALPADATYEPGREPGSGMRQARRINLAMAAGSLLEDNGLEKLFPPMGERQYAELVESMRLEGYDISKPAVQDIQTGMVLDGRARLRAAAEAGVTPEIVKVNCSDDLERLRYAIRGNLMHRYIPADDIRKIRQKLSDLRLSTTEMKKLLGRLVQGEGQVQSVFTAAQPAEPTIPSAARNSRPRLTGNELEIMRTRYVLQQIYSYGPASTTELFSTLSQIDEFARDAQPKSIRDYISGATRRATGAGCLTNEDGRWVITDTGRDFIGGQDADEATYSITQFPPLVDGFNALYHAFRQQIMMLDPDITEQFFRMKVGYKLKKTVVDIQPTRKFLRFFLNMQFADVIDPLHLCYDVSGKGHHGNGTTAICISSVDELPYLMSLVQQSYDRRKAAVVA